MFSNDATRAEKLRTIRALLAKAERTDFPDEAQALSAKAQELMARYALSELHLKAAGSCESEQIITVAVRVDRPYQRAKGQILYEVGEANRCHVLGDVDVDGVYYHLTGYQSDVDAVEMLFTSLLLQASRAMLACAVPSHVNPRSYRHSFLIGYAEEIGARLSRSTASAVDIHRQESGADLLPVLADRKAAVRQEAERMWAGQIRTSRISYRTNGGYQAGRAAGGQADLGRRRLGSRLALGGGARR
jgi:hypothetical protein